MDNTEKISVNMNIGTLSQIDMLVDQGYYSNRSDFINQAVREALHQRREDVQAIKKQNTSSGNIWFMGICVLDKEALDYARAEGEKKTIEGYGLLIIDNSIDDMVIETVSSINVRGKVRCSDRLKKHFNLK